MEFLTTTYEMVANYLMMIKVTDVIDMAIIAFVVYNILIRMRSTTSVRILQGVLVLLIIMWLSTIFDLRCINFLLSHAVQWGVLALIILFQPVESQIPNIMERIFMQYYRKAKSTNFLPTYKYLSMAENNMDTNQK